MKLDITELARRVYEGANSSTTAEEWRYRRHALHKAVEALAAKNGASSAATASYLAGVDAVADKAEAHFRRKPPAEMGSAEPGPSIGSAEQAPSIKPRSASSSGQSQPRKLSRIGQVASMFHGVAAGVAAAIALQMIFVSHVYYWPFVVVALMVAAGGAVSVMFSSSTSDTLFAMFLVAIMAWAFVFYFDDPYRMPYVADFLESAMADLAPVPVPDPRKDEVLTELLGRM